MHRCWRRLIVAFTFVEPPRSGLPQAHARATDTLVAGMKEVRGNRAMMWTVAMFASLVTAYGVLDEYIGPFLTETRSFSLGAIGVIYAALYAMRTLGMEAAHRLPDVRCGPSRCCSGSARSASRPAPSLTALPSPSLSAAYFALTAAAEVLLQTQLQQQIEGTARATVTSLAKMAQQRASRCYSALHRRQSRSCGRSMPPSQRLQCSRSCWQWCSRQPHLHRVVRRDHRASPDLQLESRSPERTGARRDPITLMEGRTAHQGVGLRVPPTILTRAFGCRDSRC